MKTPPISIEALLVLDAIETRGTYAAAAEQLNKVPSALSYIIQKLEEQLNVTLFQRQGRRAVLTPAGKHLLSEGRKVLTAINTLSEQTQTIANGWEPKIRIACDSIIDIKTIFKGIEAFLIAHQNIEIDVREEVMNGTWEALIEDKVDLVIGAPSPVPNQKGIRAIKIAVSENVLVVNKAHQLALIEGPLKSAHLSKYRNVVVHDSAQHEIPWSVNIIQGSQHFFVSSIAIKIEAIIAGIGIGYLPKNLIQHHLQSGQLVVIKLAEERPPQDLFMAWKITNKGKGLNKLITILSAQ
ncbi:LysR substrate-binding domain-containing protein [Colwellia hornerae]|uniref:LysR family transcriptional regulator n=1 Tax=Colwellia hornerae TaxID=89402 RepID=A0A5C6QRQ0_9GAMM|nr:LysR substrate-binding domain-containing protein [Colwellia hornerae]TWX57631.1 LysR family transcriptional regulator [Colwellia hornerae]TWX62638.1 LysR family transcriptional regulator [Colwellia hornerae]TWX71549.1 LysR family transcriptional regulator [Colwellia hornerae]